MKYQKLSIVFPMSQCCNELNILLISSWIVEIVRSYHVNPERNKKQTKFKNQNMIDAKLFIFNVSSKISLYLHDVFPGVSITTKLSILSVSP